MKKYNIGLIYGNLNNGGGAYQMLSLAKELSKKNNVFVFVYSDLTEGAYEKLINDIKFIVINKEKVKPQFWIYNLLEPLIISIKLSREIGSYNLDVLNPHEWPASWAAVIVKIFKKIPVVWMCNDVWHMPEQDIYENRRRMLFIKKYFFRFIDLLLFSFIDETVVLDSRIKKIISKYYNKTPIVVRSGIDIDRYKNKYIINIEKKRLHIDTNKIVFLCQSIFFPHRRFEDVILAIKIIQFKYGNLILYIIGSSKYDTSYCRKIQGLIDDNNLQGSVIIVDKFLDDNHMLNFLKACDVFVYPNFNQTWGLIAIEAMALGKPCIISNKSGVHEVIKDFNNGLIFKSKNVNDLANKMETLIKNKNLRTLIGNNARDYVFSNLSWENYSNSMLRIFHKVVLNL